MNRVNEDTAKCLMRSAGIVVPAGEVVASAEMARQATDRFGGTAVVKALVPTAKKAKHGAVKIVTSAEAAGEVAQSLIGRLIDGFVVEQLLIEEMIPIIHEFYLAMTYDPLRRSPVLLIGEHGGVDVEHAAIEGSDPIIIPINGRTGRASTTAVDEAWAAVGLTSDLAGQAAAIAANLVEVALDAGALLAEVNPLALASDGKLYAVGALFSLDGSADLSQRGCLSKKTANNTLGRPLTPLEQSVKDADDLYPGMGGVQFVQLDGNIGFAVLGGGASLFTFDAIRALGGRPANYSDISPGPGFEHKLEALMRAVMSQPRLTGLIHGWNILSYPRGLEAGATTLVQLIDELKLEVPVVARIAGVGEEVARQTLSGHPLIHLLPPRASLSDAASAIVAAIEGSGGDR